jgi:hypothetical protein
MFRLRCGSALREREPGVLTIATVKMKLRRKAAVPSIIPKKLAPHLMRGGYRFSEKIMLQR